MKKEFFSTVAILLTFTAPIIMLSGCDDDDEETSDTGSYPYVDLGLSVKWAKYNVGASSESEAGYYLSWGAIEEQDSYYYGEDKFSGKSASDISGNASYDAARYYWGGSWRMPKASEWEELFEKCTLSWEKSGSRYGYRLTSKSNGNSIFLPAAGLFYESIEPRVDGIVDYWSSTPSTGELALTHSEQVYGNSDWYNATSGNDRFIGLQIRAVSK